MGISLGFILFQIAMLLVTLTWLVLMFSSSRIERRFNAFEAERKSNGTYKQWADENKKVVAVKKWSLALLIIFVVAFGLSMVFGRTEHGFGIWTPVIFWLMVLFTSITFVLKMIFYKKALREQG